MRASPAKLLWTVFRDTAKTKNGLSAAFKNPCNRIQRQPYFIIVARAHVALPNGVANRQHMTKGGQNAVACSNYAAKLGLPQSALVAGIAIIHFRFDGVKHRF
jgi:hypothetical protein